MKPTASQRSTRATSDLLAGLAFLFLLCVLAMLAEHPPF